MWSVIVVLIVLFVLALFVSGVMGVYQFMRNADRAVAKAAKDSKANNDPR